MKKRSKDKKRKVRTISGLELIRLVEHYICIAKEEIDQNLQVNAVDTVIEYKGKTHFVGVNYDKKQARKDGIVIFSERYCFIVLDKQRFSSIDDFSKTAILHSQLPPPTANALEVGACNCPVV